MTENPLETSAASYSTFKHFYNDQQSDDTAGTELNKILYLNKLTEEIAETSLIPD